VQAQLAPFFSRKLRLSRGILPRTLLSCHSEERSDEESAVLQLLVKSRFLASLEMTRV